MKRSEINQLITEASSFWEAHGWTLPPNPRWDVTDFGLGDWRKHGLILVNLADEPEYCEKLMYLKPGMVTPMHYHGKKKEDIVCRWGQLTVLIGGSGLVELKRNGMSEKVTPPQELRLSAGERVTLFTGTWHAFWSDGECIVGEVSTANDDLSDNYFENPAVGRFSEIEEDEPAIVRLVSDP